MFAGKDTQNTVPVIEIAESEEHIDAPLNNWVREVIPEDWPKTEKYFALRVHGLSMEPRIYDHDVILCVRKNSAEYRDVSVVLYKESVFPCKYSESNGMAVLSFMNPKTTPIITLMSEVKIMGVVKELRARY